ncbi:hypothetical protein D3C78_1920500 [compost metagenome]
MASGMPILPTSCKMPASLMRSQTSKGSPILQAIRKPYCETFSEWLAVYLSLLSRARARDLMVSSAAC